MKVYIFRGFERGTLSRMFFNTVMHGISNIKLFIIMKFLSKSFTESAQTFFGRIEKH